MLFLMNLRNGYLYILISVFIIWFFYQILKVRNNFNGFLLELNVCVDLPF